jgi:hypothetical protein
MSHKLFKSGEHRHKVFMRSQRLVIVVLAFVLRGAVYLLSERGDFSDFIRAETLPKITINIASWVQRPLRGVPRIWQIPSVLRRLEACHT